MKLDELLSSLDRLAEAAGTSKPYIVGGFPRDRALGLAPGEVQDIDITTGSKDVIGLSMAASREWPTAHFRSYDDGHTSLEFKNIKVDFSNNFILPNIEDELKKQEIEDPSALQKEVFSRDFTINCLLQPMDLKQEPLDLTGKAKRDLKEKRLRTPVDPDLTIGYDPRRILRAAKLSLKLGMEIDPDLGKAMIRYRGAVADLPFAAVKKQVNQMLKMDTKAALDMLAKYKLLPMLPISKLLAMEIAKHRMVQHLLDAEC